MRDERGMKGQETEPEKGMGEGHALDLKLPIGWLLGGYGVVLTVYGLLTKGELYERSLGFNVNLAWGILMILIGGAFLLTALLKRRKR